MAQLGIGVEFLHEFAKLEPSIRRRTVEAVEKFSEHTHAGLHLEKLTNTRDARVRTIRITDSGAASSSRPTSGDRFVLLRVLPHDDAIDWARRGSSRSTRSPACWRSATSRCTRGAGRQRSGASRAGPALRQGRRRDLRTARHRRPGPRLARTLIDDEALEAVQPFMPEQPVRRAVRRWPPATTSRRCGRTSSRPASRRSRSTPTTSPPPSSARQGRIALVDGPDELLALLAKPLALWRIFLHPSQEEIAYRPSYWGSAQVTGGPGTGKTVVALHRVKHLTTAHELPPRVGPADDLHARPRRSARTRPDALLDAEQRRAVEVLNVDRWALGVVRAEHGTVTIADGRGAARPAGRPSTIHARLPPGGMAPGGAGP